MDDRVGDVLRSGPRVELREGGDRVGIGGAEQQVDVEQNEDRAIPCGGPDAGGEIGCHLGIGCPNAHEVCSSCGEVEGFFAGDRHRDQRLPLRGPRHDGRPLDGEVLAGEIDVVDLVPIDEAAGGDVADLGVVLPAVPQSRRDLGGFAGFGPQ